MFGIGDQELFLIILFAFLLFGPDKLPGMGRTIGRALRQFRTAQEGVTKVVQSEIIDPIQNVAETSTGKAAEKAAAEKAATSAADADAPAEVALETPSAEVEPAPEPEPAPTSVEALYGLDDDDDDDLDLDDGKDA